MHIQISLRKPKVFVWKILRHDLTKQGLVRIFVYCFIGIKEASVRKFEGLMHSKIFGILQTEMTQSEKQFNEKLQ